MIHAPSKSVYNKLCAENATLMFVPAHHNEIAILIKAPIIYLNEICSGCEVEFVFGVHQDSNQKTQLCSALKINDDSEHPVIFMGVDKEKEYQEAFKTFMREKRAPLFLFDEMTMNLAGAEVFITDAAAQKVKDLIEDCSGFCTEISRKEINHVLDCLTYSIDPKSCCNDAHKIDNVSINVDFGKWQKNKCFIYQEDSPKKISVNESDEGSLLEARTWFSLEMMFPLTIHKNPYYKKGAKKREVTDILAYYEYGNFLIETKALKSTKDFFKKTMERKIANVQKDIRKAIGQLVGSVKTIKYNGEIFSKSGESLSFGRSLSPQCLILVSEIFPFGDWDEITRMLLDASRKTGAIFNLLDFKNFIRLLYCCGNDPKLFDVNLVNLAMQLDETQDIHTELRYPEVRKSDN